MSGMRVFKAVTTYSAEGYRQYGSRMMQSFREQWPAEVALQAYPEAQMPEWLTKFRERHKDNRPAAGFLTHGRHRGHYNYRYDALRFAWKTAAVIDAAEAADADILIWIDADTFTHSKVTIEFLRGLAPGTNQVISWLWRERNYPECGFYMLNMRHPETRTLIRCWKELYTSDRLFQLPEWHDSFVLAECVRALSLPTKSISGAGAATGHPFINGPLGAVMDHMKGGHRKIAGRSPLADLRVVRDEAYWRQG